MSIRRTITTQITHCYRSKLQEINLLISFFQHVYLLAISIGLSCKLLLITLLLESAGNVSTGLKKATHHLHTLEMEERWYLCQKAKKTIRFNFETSGIIKQPHYIKFQYSTSWEETYLAFDCSTSPSIYLRTDHSDSSKTNVITIVLVGSARNLDKTQLDPYKNIAVLNSSS